MNQFKAQMENNQVQAKKVLIGLAKMNITKYSILQNNITSMLTSGENLLPEKGKKKSRCKACRINAMMLAASQHSAVITNIAGIYKSLFDEDLDIKELFKIVTEEVNGKVKSKSKVKEAEDPSEYPEEIQGLVEALKKTMNKRSSQGTNFTVEVVDLKKDNFGLKREDYADILSYSDAVIKSIKLKDEARVTENDAPSDNEPVLEKVQDEDPELSFERDQEQE